MKNTKAAEVTNKELSGLLADMGLGNDDEIIEAVESTDKVGQFDLEEAAAKKLENAEAMEEHYAANDNDEVTDAVFPTLAAEAPVKAKKAKGAKKTDEEKKLAAEMKAVKKVIADAEKAAKPVRKFYTSKSERVSDKVGFSILTMTDAELVGEAFDAKIAEEKATFEAAGIKVQNRMTLLLEFVGGKSTKLNEVITRAFKLLKQDGFIRSGEKGNLHVDLMTKYSAASARAMGNNTIAAMKLLKVISKNADGAYVVNEDSLVLIKIKSLGY